ncbi:bucentaur or craniofacial development-domain-containing protein [Glomus cerebriforme]|uniref:SWR1-complex protein 5 n=1 Tax=Glomus cerebriforme TaxID=658196 RepID=A0A397SPV1_9GLOM|nr:bucentaur or craniofacial development-domain-containing protein [Glomus cerebriforme]
MSTFELQENYSSDSSNDDDYVPNASEIDSEDELVEAIQGEEDNEPKLVTRSKRKKFEAEIETYNIIKKQKFEEKISKESNTIDEERKSKIDALWAELNADDDYSPIPTKPDDNVNDKNLLNNKPDETNVIEKQKFPLNKVPISTKMITITKTYKFAGDIITEHKQVPEGSDEAIAFLEEQKESNEVSTTCNETSNPILPTSSKTLNTKSSSSNVQKIKSPLPKSDNRSINSSKLGRSKINLDQLSASFKKKPTKLNTLEKSKMDWKKYVEQEQIVDELKYHNKNGYIEKQEFLQRTYERQESEIRSLRKDSRNK